MKKIMFAVILFLTACTDSGNAYRVLREQGFKNIQITGYEFFACSEDDFYSTGFIAEKDGNFVKGVVCSGFLFKSSTIRFF